MTGLSPFIICDFCLYHGIKLLLCLVLNSSLRRSKACDRHTEWRAGSIVHANLCAELH